MRAIITTDENPQEVWKKRALAEARKMTPRKKREHTRSVRSSRMFTVYFDEGTAETIKLCARNKRTSPYMVIKEIVTRDMDEYFQQLMEKRRIRNEHRESVSGCDQESDGTPFREGIEGIGLD